MPKMTTLTVYPLVCPNCGKSGQATLVKVDAGAFLRGVKPVPADDIPEGFKIVGDHARGGDIDIICQDCGVSAMV